MTDSLAKSQVLLMKPTLIYLNSRRRRRKHDLAVTRFRVRKIAKEFSGRGPRALITGCRKTSKRPVGAVVLFYTVKNN